MKILHIISSLQRGGAEELLYQHACFLKQENIKQQVLYFHEGPYSTLLTQRGINLTKIEGYLFLYDPIFLWRLYKAINAAYPQVIHSWLWSANATSSIIGRLLSIPVIISLHNNIDQNGWLRTLLDIIPLWCATRIICVSQGIYDALPFIYYCYRSKISIVTNGIQLPITSTSIKRSSLGLDASHSIIGSVGRFVSLKNYQLLINAFACLNQYYPHTRLVLIGTGPEEQQLRNLVKTLHIQNNVVFIINQPAVDYYPLFDCFCLSSYKEGISVALLEAMSHQLCCIVTCAAFTHDVIEHNKNGILVKTYEPYELFKALEHIINDHKKRSDLGSQGYTTLKNNFNLERMSKEYRNIYQKCIE